MADAGIVRNRAKIDATIGNAAAFLATAAEAGSFAAYLATIVPSPPARLGPDVRVGLDPGHDAGLGRALEPTSAAAASGSWARRSSTRSCRASGSSTTTSRPVSGIAERS